jgi:glyoxylase-like metal-dependent hydrolase (beta-lactamase superfamily II)
MPACPLRSNNSWGIFRVTLTHRLLVSAAAIFVCAPALAQDQDFSKVEIKTIPLAPNLYMLMGSGGNMVVSTGKDGSVLVDTEFAPLNGKIRAAVKAAGGTDVKFVVNTHWHGDHTGGNEPFGKAGAVIVAHNNVRVRMSTQQVMAAFNQTVPPSPAAALPTLTFPSRATFHWNGNTVNVFHVENAHTDGDSIVQFANLNVIHTGDTYMKDTFPFIDRSSNGTIDGFIKASEIVLARSDAATKIVPGHGDLATRADYQRFHDMLVKVRGNIKTLIDQGKSEDDVVAAKPTAEFDAIWGTGFMMPETFTRFAYQGLKP